MLSHTKTVLYNYPRPFLKYIFFEIGPQWRKKIEEVIICFLDSFKKQDLKGVIFFQDNFKKSHFVINVLTDKKEATPVNIVNLMLSR